MFTWSIRFWFDEEKLNGKGGREQMTLMRERIKRKCVYLAVVDFANKQKLGRSLNDLKEFYFQCTDLFVVRLVNLAFFTIRRLCNVYQVYY
jgi:hypothetical protein